MTEKFHVHVKTETGGDDVVVVEASSADEAEQRVWDDHPSIAAVVDAYLVDGGEDGPPSRGARVAIDEQQRQARHGDEPAAAEDGASVADVAVPASAYQRAVQLLKEHLEDLEPYERSAEFDAAVLVAALQQHPELTRGLLDDGSSPDSRVEQAMAAVREEPSVLGLIDARLAVDELPADEQTALRQELNAVEERLVEALPPLTDEERREIEEYEAAEVGGVFGDDVAWSGAVQEDPDSDDDHDTGPGDAGDMPRPAAPGGGQPAAGSVAEATAAVAAALRSDGAAQPPSHDDRDTDAAADY